MCFFFNLLAFSIFSILYSPPSAFDQKLRNDHVPPERQPGMSFEFFKCREIYRNSIRLMIPRDCSVLRSLKAPTEFKNFGFREIYSQARETSSVAPFIGSIPRLRLPCLASTRRKYSWIVLISKIFKDTLFHPDSRPIFTIQHLVSHTREWRSVLMRESSYYRQSFNQSSGTTSARGGMTMSSASASSSSRTVSCVPVASARKQSCRNIFRVQLFVASPVVTSSID